MRLFTSTYDKIGTLTASATCLWLAGVTPTFAACGSNDAGRLSNPLQFCSFPEFISGLLKALVTISLPIISVFIVYAGFQFVVARGNSSGIEAAKRNFLYVVIGAIMILGAWALSQILAGTVEQLRG